MRTSVVEIQRLALEGEGVGRGKGKGNPSSQGKVTFVPYSCPGETIRVQSTEEKKNFSRGLPVELLETSSHRINPPCPYHFKLEKTPLWCGGCDWQHISEKNQPDYKKELVRETLEKIGGFQKIPLHSTLRSPHMWRYRNKVQVPFAQKGPSVIAGFYAPRSHRIVAFDDCLVQPELSVQMVRFLRDYAQKARWRIYQEDRHKGWLRHVLIRTNQSDEALVSLVTQNSSFVGKNHFVQAMRQTFPQIRGLHQNVQPARTHVILGSHWIRLWGEDRLAETLLGKPFFASPGSFLQVNTKAAEVLYKKTLEDLGSSSDKIVLDLYCGVGTLTLLAASQAQRVVGVEVNKSAIRDAHHNARVNRVSQVDFIESAAETVFTPSRTDWLKSVASHLVVLLDPPRSGCERPVLEHLKQIKPARIVYVSCHPATLARDLKILSSHYDLTSVTPVDLFPQTSHIETVCRLEKRSR